MKPLAIITGGAQGIGKATALHFLRMNWRVAIIDRDAEATEEFAHSCGNDRLLAITGDTGVEDSVLHAFEQIRQWQSATDQPSGANLLVNNAGIANAHSGPIENLSLESWNRWIDSHLTSAFLCTRSAVPMLRERNGSIVNIASTRALQSEPHSEAYAAAKGALVSLTHALAISLGPDIRVNAICPGWIETGNLQKASACRPIQHSDADREQHPVGRVGVADDITGMIAFLAGPHSGFITGQSFVVDGGMTRKMIYVP